MKSRLLIIGGSGFLGSSLRTLLAAESTDRSLIDLSQSPAAAPLAELIRSRAFTHVAICAAITDVEKCFLDQALSTQVNVTGTIELLNAVKQAGATPIFFSSDYVFKPSPISHPEDGERAPETCYGKQKLLVEKYLETHFDRFLIFRTSKLMSQTPHPRNILVPIISALRKSNRVGCFSNQRMNPVFVEDIAKVVDLACRKNLQGTFHLGTRRILSRFELAQFLARLIDCDSTLIEPMMMSEVRTFEPRPTYNTLDCSKVEAALDFRFEELEDASKLIECI